MHALIIGGGVAGPATALALRKAGWDVTVLERRGAPDPDEGSCLTLAPNGLAALDVLGVRDAVTGSGFATVRNELFGAGGRRLGEFSLGRPDDRGVVALTLKRSRLAAELAAEAVRSGVDLRWGASVVSSCTEDRQVQVTLADGTELTGDLLVGADGVHSALRHRLDPAAPTPKPMGLNNFSGVTRASDVARTLTPEAWHFVFGRRCFFGAHPMPSGDVIWFAHVPGAPLDRRQRAATPAHEWLALVRDLVRDDAGPATELLLTGELEVAADPLYALPHVPVWHSARTVLVGDGAHAPSPSSGQGASISLEDAVALARAVRDLPELGSALRAYEADRRARVERVVAFGARNSGRKTPGRLRRPVAEFAIGMVFKHVVTAERTAWISEYRIDWDAPFGPVPQVA